MGVNNLKLGEAMVKEGLITNEILARALERQIIFGGRLGTNLVEMGAVQEETLAKFLGKVLGVPYAEPDLFDNVPDDVVAALPVALAEKYTAFPIKKERARLHLAMKDPKDFAAMDELRFITGLDIRGYIASEIRIVFALEKYYGIKRDLRYVSVLDHDQKEDFLSRPAPPVQQRQDNIFGSIGIADPGEVHGALEQAAPLSEPSAAAPPAPPAAVTPAPTPKPAPPAPERPAAPPAPAKTDPYEALASPKDRDHVASALAEAAARELERAVLFMVRGNAVSGWKAAGRGMTADAAASVVVSLDSPSIFKDAVEDKTFYKGPVLPVPRNVALLDALGGGRPLEAIAYPLIIKGKVVGVLYGDSGDGAMIKGDIEKLTALMGKGSMSLEILILKNKILG